jgi:UDP:flavonoid glycosyltransferase YjiC (YdhE family)
MDFPRDDWPPNFHFVGALVPAQSTLPGRHWLDEQRIAAHDELVVVSQGTIDNRDPDKLIAPTLEALRGGRQLVVACTGRRNTAELRRRFPDDNIVIEDYVPFDALLPHADVFVCNGGYGSIMQALKYGVPVLGAGKLEGKNDINARLAYRGLGIDLCSERPKPRQIAAGITRLLREPSFAANVGKVRQELLALDPLGLIERVIAGENGNQAQRRAS